MVIKAGNGAKLTESAAPVFYTGKSAYDLDLVPFPCLPTSFATAVSFGDDAKLMACVMPVFYTRVLAHEVDLAPFPWLRCRHDDDVDMTFVIV